jgi:hypothetical protein
LPGFGNNFTVESDNVVLRAIRGIVT